MISPDDTATGPDSGQPDDLSVGAFSNVGPWTVVPGEMAWLRGTDELRRQAVADMLARSRRRSIPPVGHSLVVGSSLGWYLGDRRRGRSRSRAGLSRRLRKSFEHLGPTYIKLGQILSAGEGVFPEELVAEFRLCRDQVPAEPFESVRRTVESELGAPLDQVFSSFDAVPLAAAS